MAGEIKQAEAFVKAHWPWILGGVAGLVLIYYLVNSSSAAGTSSNASSSYDPTADDVALTNASTAASTAAAQAQLQAQSLTDQYNLSLAQLQQQYALGSQANETANTTAVGNATSSYITSEGDLAQSVGNAQANMILASEALPATAIGYVEGTTQTAIGAANNATVASLAALSQTSSSFADAVGAASSSASQLVANVDSSNANEEGIAANAQSKQATYSGSSGSSSGATGGNIFGDFSGLLGNTNLTSSIAGAAFA